MSQAAAGQGPSVVCKVPESAGQGASAKGAGTKTGRKEVARGRLVPGGGLLGVLPALGLIQRVAQGTYRLEVAKEKVGVVTSF